MKNLLQKILKPRVKYEPLIEIRISKEAILHNLKTFQTTYPKFEFAPVLKSNAYGHGLVEVAEILDSYNQKTRTLTPALSQREREENTLLPFFMVDSFYEALVLRRAGIKTKILVLGYATCEQITKCNLKNVSFAIIDLEQLKNISAVLNQTTNFHLKIDTGMHRQGILPEQLDEAVKIIQSNKNILLEGACSHFADSDGSTKDFTQKQIKVWNEVYDKLQNEFENIKYFHLSNSAGAFYLPEIKANVGRLGIGLYGFNNSQFRELELHPALEMVSKITSIKTIPAGEKVGYNNTYTTSTPTKIATVPVGYNEGLDVRLSNKGFVKVKGLECPLVGRVSMNMCSIDVTAALDVKLEDEVQIISPDNQDKNSIESIIQICGTSRYEVAIHFPQHLKRIIV